MKVVPCVTKRGYFLWVLFLWASPFLAGQEKEAQEPHGGQDLMNENYPERGHRGDSVGEPAVPRTGFVDPSEQEAPLLGKEEVPFWHDSRLSLSPVLLGNINEVRKVVPWGMGLVLGYGHVPKESWYPEWNAQVFLLQFGSLPNQVRGLGWGLGLAWLYPLRVLLQGALQFAFLLGSSLFAVEDPIEKRTVHKFTFQVISGYEYPFLEKVFLFTQIRYSYIYDPVIPFHSLGVALGLSYHFMVPLRKKI
ncbi:MAG: hypothetical protein NZM25_00815 [Leptospiraceae bacterium]|nr:hypothetical protein [Leptospiraceae bacterium]MDW8306267.1 hypothetical protein [Leptospiraceae bacterium]